MQAQEIWIQKKKRFLGREKTYEVKVGWSCSSVHGKQDMVQQNCF